MKTKNFDCVQMKRLGAAKVREQTETLTREQELRFWQERSQYLRQRQASLKVDERIWADRPEVQDPVQFTEHLRRTIDTQQVG
jgi:hypothetical protein